MLWLNDTIVDARELYAPLMSRSPKKGATYTWDYSSMLFAPTVTYSLDQLIRNNENSCIVTTSRSGRAEDYWNENFKC